MLIFSVAPALAQSTLGSILGTVIDPSGAVVPRAVVTATNTDENTTRVAATNGSGDYEFVNSKPGHYKLEVQASGFQDFTARNIRLAARQAVRVDARLQVGPSSTSLNVEDTAGVIATDTPAVQSSVESRELLDLPVNIRGTPTTSAYWMLAVLPGMQPDDNGNYSVQGGFTHMAQFSADGISITDMRGNSPLTEAFPSFESIAEITVQGVGNSAEFGEVGDVNVVSKSGTNQLHGVFFWNHQNRAFDAKAYGQLTKPQKVGNNSGVTAGGPVVIPKLYNGRNKTFFFGTFESNRYPLGVASQSVVPTSAMRNGDFSRTGITPNDPLNGQPFPQDVIPPSRINPVARRFLKLYPLPNVGNSTTVQAANYINNHDNSTFSNQDDIRFDHYLKPTMSVFGRWTWKGADLYFPENLTLPSLKGVDGLKLGVISLNWTLRPNLVNEFRAGFTIDPQTYRFPFDCRAFIRTLGLDAVGPGFPTNNLPELDINGYTGIATDRDNGSRSSDHQWNNNTSWTIGRHKLKFGFDIRRLRLVLPLIFRPGDNYGNFSFTGVFSSDPFADFLLGIPDHSVLSFAPIPVTEGRGVHYGVFAQDVFRINQRLTLEYGLRWEYHPAFQSITGNIGNFDPGVLKSGAVIYPTGKQSLLFAPYLESFNACPAPEANGAPCTPVLSARQAHVPESLRFVPARVAPRFGFALRPFANEKTVLRGDFSVYNTPGLGEFYTALDGTLQASIEVYPNVSPTNGQPIFQWPQVRTPAPAFVPALGNAAFVVANQIHWKEPYSMQWNFSIDRDLGFNTGLRVSYIGMGTRDLTWNMNINQSLYSTQYYLQQPLSRRPFPNWYIVGDLFAGANANYESTQVEVSHRFRYGLVFHSTYTLAKNLADDQGSSPSTGFPGEAFNGLPGTDAYNRRGQYGEVSASRRQRWITTALYELPFGRGHALLSTGNRLVNGLVGGWRLSGIFLIQSGPFETPVFYSGDPSGTGSGTEGFPQHPDRVKSGSLAHPAAKQWIDPAAFVCPGVPGWTSGRPCTIGLDPFSGLPPIGRFGNSGLGIVTGPGTVNVSMGLGKSFPITERMKLRIAGSFTNILNHVNLGDPQIHIDAPGFGQITSARGSDFGGNRTGQVSVRIEF